MPPSILLNAGSSQMSRTNLVLPSECTDMAEDIEGQRKDRGGIIDRVEVGVGPTSDQGFFPVVHLIPHSDKELWKVDHIAR